MEKIKETKKENVFKRLLEDKRAINACIRRGGDINEVAKERGIKLAMPLRIAGRR